MKCRLALAVLVLALPVQTFGGQPTYEALWLEASKDPGCSPQDQPHLTLVICKEKRTGWYFTKPDHPAHPGVIKRVIERQPDGVWVAQEDANFFGPASAHPAFMAWLSEVADQDRKLKEAIEKAYEKQM